ncbi:MAG: pyridoxal phosphate-dependent aminotransferase family protein [Planctomycetota bacterium]|nr:pyridoxal phosphate-dependent aminotransferase family protein [Planctomycetota bacterium]
MARLPIHAAAATHVMIDGQELLAFAGCNYLGLAQHAKVREAVVRGMEDFGLSTSASRETTGNTSEHESLETELAAFVGGVHDDADPRATPATATRAILTPEGYTANLAMAQGLAALGVRTAIIDEKSHTSVGHAAASAGMRVETCAHLSALDARRRIERALASGAAPESLAIMTDGVFAADGAIAPVAALAGALPKGATLVVDDCHGFCVLGPHGRGTCAAAGLPAPGTRDLATELVITTTLGKGLGCYGGSVIGSSRVFDAVRRSASVYRGTTPVPPPIARAARTAISMIRRDDSLVASLRANTSRLRDRIRSVLRSDDAHDSPVSPSAPIFTFMLPTHDAPDAALMERVHRRLLARGILAPLIEYPGGPGSRYFRLTLSALHTPTHIDRLADELHQALLGT